MTEQKRTYNPDEPVALDDRDPGNADIVDLVQPLDPDDNVFSLVNPDHDDAHDTAPVQDPTRGD